jgi:outer membrane lipopolysaccharide assembly protein LptE/RlpB
MTRLRLALAAAPLAALLGCGYHVSGHADLLPKNLRTIAVPAFGNVTTRYKLADRLSGALTREFLTRTRYRIVADPNQADAVLHGTLLNCVTYPTVFDPATGRASGVMMVATVDIRLVSRATGETIFARPSMEIRERYEIASDPLAYFEESDTAVERMSREAARSIVSAVLEKF